MHGIRAVAVRRRLKLGAREIAWWLAFLPVALLVGSIYGWIHERPWLEGGIWLGLGLGAIWQALRTPKVYRG